MRHKIITSGDLGQFATVEFFFFLFGLYSGSSHTLPIQARSLEMTKEEKTEKRRLKRIHYERKANSLLPAAAAD
jgi:hypothetical protein